MLHFKINFSCLIVLIYCCYINLCMAQNVNIDSIFWSAQNKLFINEQFNFKCKYSSLNVGSIDTFKLINTVKLKKIERGYLKKIDVAFPNKKNIEVVSYYDIDQKFYYVKNIEKNEVEFVKIYNEGTGVVGYFHSGLINFIDSNIVNNYNSTMVKTEFVGIDTFNNLKCFVINSYVPNFSEPKNHTTTRFFNCADSMLVRIIIKYELKSEPVFFDFKIVEYDFRKDKPDSFFVLPNLNSYSVIFDTSEEIKNTFVLLNNKIKPTINGINIKTKQVEKIKLTNKITLIDFWYMACYGCVLSYPVVDSLYNHFKNDPTVQILSFNGIDINPKLNIRLRQYIKDYNMNTNSYTISSNDFNTFKEKAMPFFLIIDKNGIIKFHTVGYHTNLFNEIKTQILKLKNQ